MSLRALAATARKVSARTEDAVLLAGVSAGFAIALAVILLVTAGTVTSSATFGVAAQVAPIRTWAVVFALAGLVVLGCLARRPETLALALLMLAILTLGWAALAGVAAAYSGGLATAAVAYVALATYQAVSALAAARRADRRR